MTTPTEKTTKKICTRCKENKLLKLFPKDRRTGDGFRDLCKTCRNKDRQIIKKANTNRQAILKEQDNACAICCVNIEESATKFVIDHDHRTNKVRGILCSNCNVGLGYFKDQPLRLGQAIKYLEVYDGIA